MNHRHVLTATLAIVGLALVGASYQMLDKNAALLFLFVYLLIVPFVHELFVRFGRTVSTA